MEGRNIFKKGLKKTIRTPLFDIISTLREFAIKWKELVSCNYFPHIRNKWCSAGLTQVVYLELGKETKAWFPLLHLGTSQSTPTTHIPRLLHEIVWKQDSFLKRFLRTLEIGQCQFKILFTERKWTMFPLFWVSAPYIRLPKSNFT